MTIRNVTGAALIAVALLPGEPLRANAADYGEGAFQVAEFKLRTVRPPKPGARKRIVLLGEAPTASRRSAPASAAYAWFWREVDPARAAGSPQRFASLLVQYESRFAGQWAGFGNPDRARNFAREHMAAISDAARRSKLSPALLLAVIAVESAGRTKARSPKGAQGLMQLMPATARRFDVSNPYDATQNIAGGAAYLDFLLNEFGGDALLALAGYNAGEGAVEKHAGVPPYAETRDYVPKVLAAFLDIRRLCSVPPTGPRDACVLFEES